MKYRTASLMAYSTLSTAGTEIIDINLTDPITALRFYVKTTVSTGEHIAPLLDVISKIEIVDGSDVLMSLSGTQLAALHFYEGNEFIMVDDSNMLSTTLDAFLQINFGRYVRDPDLAFDPKMFRNPQIKVTYNGALQQALGTTLYLEVDAECFDEKVISPVGFLRMTELYSYTPGASTYEYIDLPTDLPIRKLYLQTKAFGYAAANLLTDIKLSEDNDKKVPFALTEKMWLTLCAQNFGYVKQNIWADTRGVSAYIFAAPCSYETTALTMTSGVYAFNMVGMTGGCYTIAAGATSYIVTGLLAGLLPYYVWCYPFGDQKDISDWYDLTNVGSLKLRVKSGAHSANGTNKIILQQLRRY